MTPDDIALQVARDALTDLGETPGDDPIAQLQQIADESSALLQDMRERQYITNQVPTDPDEYTSVRDRTFAARLGIYKAHAAREAAELDAQFELPDAKRDGDTAP